MNDFTSIINPLSWNGSGLTMTSFLFNGGQAHSTWVDYILGSKAVFNITSRLDISTDIYSAYRKHNIFPDAANMPSCSIELLGFNLIKDFYPFNIETRRNIPALGTSTLYFDESNMLCYYRAMYEGWRKPILGSGENMYWPTFFYCPILPSNINICHSLRRREDPVSFRMEIISSPPNNSIYLPNSRSRNEEDEDDEEEKENSEESSSSENTNTTPNHLNKPPKIWEDQFQVQVQSHIDIINHQSHLSSYTDYGVCLVLPYETSSNKRKPIVTAMLIESIRYYTTLGFKIMIFDAYSKHYNALFNNDIYMTTQKIHLNYNYIHYYNYTIRSKYHMKAVKFDNTEKAPSMSRRMGITDNDKVWTLTHCRHEMKALYGIDRVIVMDTDEFLYCPSAGSNIKTMKEILKKYFRMNIKAGYDELILKQQMIAPTTDDPAECMYTHILYNQSILTCYQSSQYIVGKNRYKAIHLNHNCPFTDYHQACLANDCYCHSKMMDDTCFFMHLTTSIDKLKGKGFKPHTSHTQNSDKNSENSETNDSSEDSRTKNILEIYDALKNYKSKNVK